ncbi:MAG: urea ABC transporter permease subunit UrtB [Gammaproteobacteria bacterium]|nr:urea ABC transporter permease subunit UrtB [Gammaproteobacteria bacterium]
MQLFRFLLRLLACALLIGATHADDIAVPLAALNSDDFEQKAQALIQIENSKDPHALPLFQALLDGNLFQRKQDDKLVYALEADGGYTLTDVLSGDALGTAGKRDVRKITVNNALRNQLQAAIARLSLTSSDAKVRLAAVNNILKDATPGSADLLRTAVLTESDSDVVQAMQLAIALADFGSTDVDTRIRAVSILQTSLNPDVRNRLAAGGEIKTDKILSGSETQLRDMIEHALASIDARVSVYRFAESVFFGISLGSVLLLAAIGLAITFGVMGVINMAHGELMMLGAYTTYVVQLLMPNHLDTSLFVAIPAAFVVAGLVGIAIERGVIRFLYGRPLETLLATLARAMGVRSAWVDAFTFGLGSGIAGVAGVALSQLTNVGPNLGQSYIIDAFMVVVFGGVGNLWGTLVGAMSLGVVNKFLEPWSGAVLAKVLVLVFIILFIQKKPRGLFPQKGRAANDYAKERGRPARF